MITSAELTPEGMSLSGSGTLKDKRVPVVILLGEKRAGSTLSCALALFHAGLEPGVYPMSDGCSVVVPKALVSTKHEAHPHVTLEVIQ
jgi:predicted peroxiredoxin